MGQHSSFFDARLRYLQGLPTRLLDRKIRKIAARPRPDQSAGIAILHDGNGDAAVLRPHRAAA